MTILSPRRTPASPCAISRGNSETSARRPRRSVNSVVLPAHVRARCADTSVPRPKHHPLRRLAAKAHGGLVFSACRAFPRRKRQDFRLIYAAHRRQQSGGAHLTAASRNLGDHDVTAVSVGG